MSRTAKGTGPRPRTEPATATPPPRARLRDHLGIWWWPATWAAGAVVAGGALFASGSPYPWLYGPAVAAGVSASAAGRHRLINTLGSVTSWAAIGLMWAAILAAIALTAPGICVDPTGAATACGATGVAMWASLGPIVTLAILFGTLVWRIATRSARVSARLAAVGVSAGVAGMRSMWALRAVEMAGGAAVAGAGAAVAGGHGGIIITAACVGASVSPIISPFGTRGDRTKKGGRSAEPGSSRGRSKGGAR